MVFLDAQLSKLRNLLRNSEHPTKPARKGLLSAAEQPHGNRFGGALSRLWLGPGGFRAVRHRSPLPGASLDGERPTGKRCWPVAPASQRRFRHRLSRLRYKAYPVET